MIAIKQRPICTIKTRRSGLCISSTPNLFPPPKTGGSRRAYLFARAPLLCPDAVDAVVIIPIRLVPESSAYVSCMKASPKWNEHPKCSACVTFVSNARCADERRSYTLRKLLIAYSDRFYCTTYEIRMRTSCDGDSITSSRGHVRRTVSSLLDINPFSTSHGEGEVSLSKQKPSGKPSETVTDDCNLRTKTSRQRTKWRNRYRGVYWWSIVDAIIAVQKHL